MIEVKLLSKQGQERSFAFDHALAILQLNDKYKSDEPNWKINDPDYEYIDGKIRAINHTGADSDKAGEQFKNKSGKKKRDRSGY